jgi:protein SCO1/2
VLLYCYHYDPSQGKYGLAVMNAMRLGGLITVAFVAGFLTIMFRRDFRTRGA